MRFWISWYQAGEDYRPAKWPLPPEIAAYWCTGGSDAASTLCAIVDAPDEAAAKTLIVDCWGGGLVGLMDWDSAWRFCNEREPGWKPESSRFPWPEWAKGRS